MAHDYPLTKELWHYLTPVQRVTIAVLHESSSYNNVAGINGTKGSATEILRSAELSKSSSIRNLNYDLVVRLEKFLVTNPGPTMVELLTYISTAV